MCLPRPVTAKEIYEQIKDVPGFRTDTSLWWQRKYESRRGVTHSFVAVKAGLARVKERVAHLARDGVLVSDGRTGRGAETRYTVGVRLAGPDPAAPAAKTLTVRGEASLSLGGFVWDDKTMMCAGWSSYSDVKAGTEVVVTDAAGKTLGVARLGYGKPTGVAGSRATGCSLPFTVDVPAGAGPYGIDVASRGKRTFTEAELVTFALGS